MIVHKLSKSLVSLSLCKSHISCPSIGKELKNISSSQTYSFFPFLPSRSISNRPTTLSISTQSPVLSLRLIPSQSLQYMDQQIRFLNCWNCQKELEKDSEFALLVCPKCDNLQKLRGENIPNYFELLGQSRITYQVDVSELSSKVKRLQRKLHPDLYAQKGKEAEELSEELSSLVNKAFSTLSNPIERGRYILKLLGVDDPEGDAEKTLTNDPEFLQDVMDLNERLEELKTEQDWKDFRTQNRTSFSKLETKLEDALAEKNTKSAQIILGRMKYYDTLEIKLRELKGKLGIVE